MNNLKESQIILVTFKYLGIYWFPFLIFYGGICLVIAGGVGRNLGLPHLFRDDPALCEYGRWALLQNSPAILTQAAATLLVGILLTFVFLIELNNDPKRGVLYCVIIPAIIFSSIPLGAAIFRPFARKTVLMPDPWEIIRMICGTLLGIILTLILIKISEAIAYLLQFSQALSLLGVLVIGVVGAVAMYHKIVPAVSLFLLLYLLSAGYFALILLPEQIRVFGLIVLIALIYLGNLKKYKYKFPGISSKNGVSCYDDIVNLPRPSNNRVKRPGKSKNGGKLDIAAKSSNFLIDPLESLMSWRASYNDEKPKLVVVATSGGAYRAAFWTAIVLEKLIAESKEDKDLPGFINSIRLITGASGGMVGAAYFAATRGDTDSELLVERINRDIKESQKVTKESKAGLRKKRLGTKYPIPRDSLSPVAQQLAQRDVFKAFWPMPQNMDRGRVLESQWTTLKNKTFALLRKDELAGLGPSLILSPMLVETGQPLLISNLNLSSLRDVSKKEAVEFFKWFPHAHDSFGLHTAVRMNATFPYVSPAVSLPTEPPRRVVDAGYYDNYGINLAVAYLRERNIRKWVQNETSGVAILQVRAFPIDSLEEKQSGNLCQDYGPKDREKAWPRALQWLTSPLEGAGAARESSMVFRNDQELRSLQNLYKPDFIKSITLENAARASMSWYLPLRELDCMYKELGSTHNSEQLIKLKKFWNEG